SRRAYVGAHCCITSHVLCHDPPPPDTHPLSLHDALPICPPRRRRWPGSTGRRRIRGADHVDPPGRGTRAAGGEDTAPRSHRHPRSEEHTSELQSRFDLVCRLLLEKKNEEYTTSETQAPTG